MKWLALIRAGLCVQQIGDPYRLTMHATLAVVDGEGLRSGCMFSQAAFRMPHPRRRYELFRGLYLRIAGGDFK